MRSCPVFKKTITLDKSVVSATLSITAHGIYEASLNSKRIGEAYFTPGWTSYDKRIQYQVYNIKDQFKKGNNELQVTIGEGWYRGAFGGLMERDNYGKDASLLCQIDILFKDGSKEQIVSDNTWSSGAGPIIHSDIYGGEIYDAGVDTKQWYGVTPIDSFKALLVPSIAEPVKKQEVFKPVKVFKTNKGEQVIDFGQNMSGWVHFKVKGKPGDTIKLFHAEVLDKEGNFYTGNLRDAAATDIYILRGNGEESFEPHFTWHGFRYVKVEGCIVQAKDFTAVALYSAMAPSGSFSCSNPKINQLQHNIEWSLKSNFLDIPTDCPQRSERLGWTGDAQVFFRTASFNYNVKQFYTKWLEDLKADQRDNGSVPNIIPNIYRKLKSRKLGVAGWGDAATIIPWSIYWVYGDSAILCNQYNSMKAWVDHIDSVSENGLWAANGYGDWLAPGDSTSLPFINQCFWAYSTQLLINAGTVLGYNHDVSKYTSLLQQIKTAFLQHYMQPEGKTMPNTQTSYVLALELHMLPDSLEMKSAGRLEALVRTNSNHLATGFLGTPYLLHALSKHGYVSTAYDLLNQDTYPSWLYPVKMGATTIWEKWDAIRPDSTVQATSYNHYSYGAVGDWLYRVVAGIDAASPGYKNIIIRPRPGGGLTWVKASYNCPQGRIVSNWEIDGGKVIMHIEIPAGTKATIYVPGKENVEVGEGKFTFEGINASVTAKML
ncbi:family 78 glycoside hydrolase catalytic domain [Chitinophaga oryziterrae]|nr:family 78 glycoside hydrolase catalytic domain [Chitinophaga oryziterrae]